METGVENFYQLLGVSADADTATIKQAWRQLAARWHPDVTSTAASAGNGHAVGANRSTSTADSASDLHRPLHGTNPEIAEQFVRIQRAYSVLGHADRRRAYDAYLRSQQLGQEQTAIVGMAHSKRNLLEQAYLQLAGWLPTRQGLWAATRFARVRYLALAVLLSGLVLIWETGSARKRVASSQDFSAAPTGEAAMSGESGNRGNSGTVPPSPSPVQLPSLSAVSTVQQQLATLAGQPSLMAESPKAALNVEPTGAGDSRRQPATQPACPPGLVDAAVSGREALDDTCEGASHANAGAPSARPAAYTGGTAIASAPPHASVPSPTDPPTVSVPLPHLPSLLTSVPRPRPEPLHAAIPEPLGRDPGPWLAGCVTQDAKAIHTGVVSRQDQAILLQWQALGGISISGHQRLLLMRESGVDMQPSAAQPKRLDNTGIPAILQGGPFATAVLQLEGNGHPTPCGKWHLLSLTGLGQGVNGRWVAVERAPRSDDLFLLDSMELSIETAKAGLAGHLRGRYRLSISHPASTAAAGSFQSLVEFRFQSNGPINSIEIPWRSDTLGTGTLRIAPLGPGRMALHWQLRDLKPGRIQLSGGSAILYRRH